MNKNTEPEYQNNAITMCRYILPLPADTITPVQRGIFVTCSLCHIQSHTKHSRPRPRPNLKAKARDLDCKVKVKYLMHQGQGQGLGLQGQGQGLDASIN